MPRPVQPIGAELIEQTVELAQLSARKRINHNFHNGPADNPHRFLNVFLHGSYVAPHRHIDPPKSETFLVLEGSMALACFDDEGQVTVRYTLSATGPLRGVDLPPGIWHTVAALSPVAVCFEVKPGPWDPATDKEFAPWAPQEGDVSAPTYLEKLISGFIAA